jgi:peptidoglycan/xylan/chitin deacetylase (PgdA/CDA1 family)
VLTFDDGYVDTATQVLPLLERARVPATVFVTPGSPGRPFWWDELTQMLLRHSPLPPRLALDVRGRRHSWVLSDGGRPNGDRAARRRALLEVAAALRDLDPKLRRERMREIREWCGDAADAPQRGLTLDEIRRLASNRLVEIGAHTMSHPVLPSLPFEMQMEEIQQSRITLERVAGRPVRAFSYPHGSFSAVTVAGVRAAGFSMACCSTPDVARARSEVLTLPRLWAPNLDGPGFEAWLTRWLVS